MKHPAFAKALRLALPAAALLATASAFADDAVMAEPFSPSAGRQASFPGADGKQIYERICQGCHMADGSGARQGPSAYPAMAANPKFVAKAYPAALVVNGMGAMPAFGTMLNDEQVAAVVNFVRSSFTNRYEDQLSAAEVKPLRPASQAAPTELRGR